MARLALALAGLSVGILSLLGAWSVLAERAGYVELLVKSGLDERLPEIAATVERETDPARAGILTGRALLADALEQLQRMQPPLEASAVEEIATQLASARELGDDVRRRRPAAWQAHMIVGAATYLEWTLRRDRRVATESTSWEAPLQTAIALAPSHAEPKRFLTMAYLELWPMLSTEKRELARGLVAIAFEDPRLLARLLPHWLALARSLDEALAAVPDDYRAWSSVQDLFVRREEWERAILARRRAHENLRRECESRLDAAARLRGRRAARRIRQLVLPVVTAMPVEASWADLLTRTLERLPAGLPGEAASARLRQWLEWNLEGCALGRCRLPPRSAARLAVLAGDLTQSMRARAALAADDLASAEAFERRAERVENEAWAQYLIEKVPHLLQRKERAAAAATLAAVHSSHRSSLAFLHAERALAETSEDEEALAAVRLALDRRARQAWRADEWLPAAAPGRSRRPAPYRLSLQVAVGAGGLELTAVDAPPGGAVAELRVDGAAVAIEPLRRAGEAIRVWTAVPAGPHLLELDVVAGGPVVPGPGRLLDVPR
jgi:hypothetical protein